MYNRGLSIDFIFLTGKIVVLFLSMTMRKKNLPESVQTAAIEVDDDYYGIEKKRIEEEAQRAHRIHEEDIQTHLTAMIPYYDDAEENERRLLLQLNNLLVQRFEEVWMVYWAIFRQNPNEIAEYSDIFGDDLAQGDIARIISFLETKKDESKNMVEMGFDEDGEDDDLTPIEDPDEIGNGREEEYVDTEEE